MKVKIRGFCPTATIVDITFMYGTVSPNTDCDCDFVFSWFAVVTNSCPPVAVVLARKRMAGQRVESFNGVDFDVVEVADTMGWQLPLVKRGLRQLQFSSGTLMCLCVCMCVPD